MEITCVCVSIDFNMLSEWASLQTYTMKTKVYTTLANEQLGSAVR